MTASGVWIVSRRPDGVPVMTPAVFIAEVELFGSAQNAAKHLRTARWRERHPERVRAMDRAYKARQRAHRRSA